MRLRKGLGGGIYQHNVKIKFYIKSLFHIHMFMASTYCCQELFSRQTDNDIRCGFKEVNEF